MTSPSDLRQPLEAAIAELRSRRTVLGDTLVDAALAPLLKRLAALSAAPEQTDLTTAAEPSRRLRQVSVLFLDLVGSTQLIQTLDPEEVQAVVDGALAAFTAIVRQYGGEVLRYAGDNLKVAFGAHDTAGTREDDAERAVHCGLALLAEAARRGDEVKRLHGHEGFNARVGIHTGGVVRGGGVENDNSLSGLAVNIAARLEQAAPAGALRISVDTYRQVQGRFDVQAQPALLVKGLQEPLQTFLVMGERERRLRGLRHGVEGTASALVGRDAELTQLREVTARVFTQGGLSAATVVGEAGLGKSRLLAEALAEVMPEAKAALPDDLLLPARAAALWSASSHPQGLNQPCGLLRDLLFWHHGVKDSDTQAQAQQKFAAALAPIFGETANEQTALLGQLIGLDYSASPFIAGILRDGKQLRARGFHAWAQYLRLQAVRLPLVLVLDDLQWADDESLDAIEYLVAVGGELPLMLLCGARPELLQRRPDWGNTWPAHQRLVLAPLAEPASHALAGALLQRLAQPAPQLHALLSAQAAGNPFYMEALMQMLVDTGFIQTQTSESGESARWQVQDSQLQTLKVPTTLVAVLQATLDALKPGERQCLQQASVVGALFWDEALAAINPQAPAHLPAIARRELALSQLQSAFERTQAYAFRHHLLHQVTYGTVLKPDKREGHYRAALWLQARSAGREAEMASQMAEHFERAGVTDRAVHYWTQAAEDASRRQADSAALAHAERALALDDGSDLRGQVRIHRARAAAFMRAGRAAEHAEVIAVLESLADRLDDDVLRLAVATDQVWRLYLDSHFKEAVDLGQRRLARGESHSPADAARVHNVVFVALCRLGRFDEALVHGQRGLEQARTVGDLLTQGHIHNNIALLIHLDANRVSQALVCLKQALDAYSAAGSRFSVALVQVNLALVDDTLCRPERAREELLRTLQVCQEVGARQTEAMVRANLSLHLCEQGEPHGAHAHALRGLLLAQGAGDRFSQAQAHAGVYVAARALGFLAEASTHARAARAAFAEHGQWELAWHYASATASLLSAAGESATALAEADAVLAEVAEKGGWTDFCFNGPIHLYRVLAPLGDPRAAGLLQTAHQRLNALADRYAEFVPREQFLRATALRREIGDAWAAVQAA